MLPQLYKKKSNDAVLDGKFSQGRLGNSDNDIAKQSINNVKSVSAKKVRTGGGFMKSNVIDQIQAKQSLPTQKFIQQQQYQKYVKIRKVEDLSAQIKLIEKKIKVCQKKLQEDKKKQKLLAQQRTRDNNRPDYNFQKVVQRELQMQGFSYQTQQQNQNFDYLTNPKLRPGEQEQEEPQIVVQKKITVQNKPYNIQAGIQKLEKFYENSLKKKFQRREMFPHQACRRKTPKLYITQKTNALNKYGKAQNEAEHLFRVLTKETTPQQIYPTIPNFAVVKDNLSKNIVAYLGDYKPFIQKTKQAAIGSGVKMNQNSQQQNYQTRQNYLNQSKNSNKRSQQELKINAIPKIKTSQRQAL